MKGDLGIDLSPDGYLLGSYRIATAPEPNSSRLTSFKSIHFDTTTAQPRLAMGV